MSDADAPRRGIRTQVDYPFCGYVVDGESGIIVLQTSDLFRDTEGYYAKPHMSLKVS